MERKALMLVDFGILDLGAEMSPTSGTDSVLGHNVAHDVFDNLFTTVSQV